MARLTQVADRRSARYFSALLAGAAAHLYGQRIAGICRPNWDDLTPPKEWAEMNYWAVRAYNYYYGVTHVLSGMVEMSNDRH